MRAAAFALLLLAGCNNASDSPRAPLTPSPSQAAADAAAADYTACIDQAAAAVDVAADQPAVLTDKALKACIVERATLVDRVAAAQRAAGKDQATAALVAERSVRVADSNLRDRANTAIVTRKLKAS